MDVSLSSCKAKLDEPKQDSTTFLGIIAGLAQLPQLSQRCVLLCPRPLQLMMLTEALAMLALFTNRVTVSIIFLAGNDSALVIREILHNVSSIPHKCKRQWTLLVIVKDQPSHLVYLKIMPTINKPVKSCSSIGHGSCEIIMKEKTPLSHEVVCV